MRSETPQEKGYSFEKTFGAALGMEPTRGSGNQWFAKMDLGGSQVLISCKHTNAQSYRIEKQHLREIQRYCSGMQEPAMAIDIDGEVYVLQRAGDWIASRTEEATRFIQPQKAEMKRATASVPGLLRGEA